MLERYYRELLNFCARTVKDRDAAADVVQESYARVLAAQQSGQSILEPRALLHQTARRIMIDQHRRLEHREHDDIDSLAEVEHPTAPIHLQPDAIYSNEQQARALIATIDALPPRCREAFVLNRFEGLSHKEVADRMGISKNMVAQHVIRGVLMCKASKERLNTLPLKSEGQNK